MRFSPESSTSDTECIDTQLTKATVEPQGFELALIEECNVWRGLACEANALVSHDKCRIIGRGADVLGLRHWGGEQ